MLEQLFIELLDLLNRWVIIIGAIVGWIMVLILFGSMIHTAVKNIYTFLTNHLLK